MPRAATTSAKSTPKDVFLHLLAIVTLIVSVVSFIMLWFQYINVRFPDALQYYGSGSAYLNTVRQGVAALVVVFPVYILVCWILGRDYKADPSRREVRARKWLLYLTLFISAITIIIDLITLVYNYLNGDLNVSFLLKIVVVLATAAGIFGYYIWDLRRDNFNSKWPKWIAWKSLVVVAITAGIGFWLVGTPATQRDRKFDERRVSDLQMIQSGVTDYWVNKRVLPSSLADLYPNSNCSDARCLDYPNLPLDPQTNSPYEYSINNDLSFELCANFKLPSQSDTNVIKPAYNNSMPYPYNDNWDHGPGRVCFTRTINPTLYPTNSPKPL